ncbi:alcohol dehydrogenase [Brachybacterium endophyticum]|uniref:Alcohol dehydrogenase n=1 Tax=Brachybacterium endophyticum TaxID=2182385 RepID=A0A2U2RJU7_9MICO|nr:NADP-dependent oxidoreductase [Brachybacterium endophyticum]PWH06075.1 alcohol dehydrogenase [Brachybacterium endophyticum]
MRAVVAPPEAAVPQVAEVPDPAPGPGEVLIRVGAASVNPADLAVVSGAVREAFGLSGTVGLGWDAAGTVEALGDGVEDLHVGDRVAGIDAAPPAPTRAQAELIALDRSAVARIPEGLGLLEAGTVPLNVLTADAALDALEQAAGPAAGRRLLITGAAGAVGGYALDLARERGWEVDGLARPSDAEFVERTGARLVGSIEPGAYVGVLDAANLHDDALAALGAGGVLVGLTGPWRESTPEGVTAVFANTSTDGDRLGELLERSLTEAFAPRIAQVLDLEDAAQAYRTAQESGSRGRVVLRIG